MLTSKAESIQFIPSQLRSRARHALLRVTTILEAWFERHRQRRALRELSEHVLKDIGIGRGEAEQEGRKPFWRD